MRHEVGAAAKADEFEGDFWSRYSGHTDLVAQILTLRAAGDAAGAKRLTGQLVEAMQPVLKMAARRLDAQRGSLEVEDLLQVGAIEVVKAIDTFNIRKSQSFAAWVYYWGRRAMLHMTRLHSADVKPSEGAQRGRLKRSPGQTSVSTLSIDADPQATGSITPARLEQAMGGDDESPEAQLESEQMRALVRRYMTRLPRALSELVAQVHGIGRPATSLREIARDRGEPRAKLDKMLKRAEAMLQQMIQRELRVRRSKSSAQQ